MKTIHFKSQKERLKFIKKQFEEIEPIEVIEEPKPKKAKKGKKKDGKVQAE